MLGRYPPMRNKSTPVLACIALLLCAGCCSFYAHTNRDDYDSRVYPGVTRDATLVAHPDPAYWTPAPVTVACGLLDFIPSAVLDTLLLPIDLARPSAETK